jgi:hypothetical protein
MRKQVVWKFLIPQGLREPAKYLVCMALWKRSGEAVMQFVDRCPMNVETVGALAGLEELIAAQILRLMRRAGLGSNRPRISFS